MTDGPHRAADVEDLGVPLAPANRMGRACAASAPATAQTPWTVRTWREATRPRRAEWLFGFGPASLTRIGLANTAIGDERLVSSLYESWALPIEPTAPSAVGLPRL